MGTIQAAKGMKGEGGGEAEGGGKAEKAGKAKGGGGQAEAKKEDNAIDKFLGLLNNPNVKSINDIKSVRDQILQKLQEQGIGGEKAENAKKKLNQAILQKLGIGKPGAGGAIEVDLTPKNQQLLQFLGMKPDQTVGGKQAPPPQAPAPVAAGR